MAKKPKVKKQKGKANTPAASGEETVPTKKKGGLIGHVVLTIALAAASFSTVFLIPGNELPMDDSGSDGHAPAHSETIALELDMDPTFIELTPFTISLDGGNSLLKIGITLEASEDASYDIDPNNPQLRDAFTGYLRALKPSQIRDAAYMARLRAQLLRRARLVFGTDAVYGILITDFLVQ